MSRRTLLFALVFSLMVLNGLGYYMLVRSNTSSSVAKFAEGFSLSPHGNATSSFSGVPASGILLGLSCCPIPMAGAFDRAKCVCAYRTSDVCFIRKATATPLSSFSGDAIVRLYISAYNNAAKLDELIDSIDYKIDEVVVLQDGLNEEVAKTISSFHGRNPLVGKVSHYIFNERMGVGGVWNMAFRLFPGDPFWIIVADGTVFPRGELQKFHLSIKEHAGDSEKAVIATKLQRDTDDSQGVVSRVSNGYAAWATTRQGVLKVGMRDENYFPFPAFLEDWDYNRRIQLSSMVYFSVDAYVIQGAGESASVELTKTLHRAMTDVYMTAKWGCSPRCPSMCNDYSTPFNIDMMPVHEWLFLPARAACIMDVDRTLCSGQDTHLLGVATCYDADGKSWLFSNVAARHAKCIEVHIASDTQSTEVVSTPTPLPTPTPSNTAVSDTETKQETETDVWPMPSSIDMVVPECDAPDPEWPSPTVSASVSHGPFLGPFAADERCAKLSVCEKTRWLGDGGSRMRTYPFQHTVENVKSGTRYILNNMLLRQTGTPPVFEVVCSALPDYCKVDPEQNECTSIMASTLGIWWETTRGIVRCVDQLDLPADADAVVFDTTSVPTYFSTSGAEWNLWHMYQEGLLLFANMWEDGFVCVDKTRPGSVAQISPVRMLRTPLDHGEGEATPPAVYEHMVGPLLQEQVPLAKEGKYRIHGQLGVGFVADNLGDFKPPIEHRGTLINYRSPYETELERMLVPHYRNYIFSHHGLDWRCGSRPANHCHIVVVDRVNARMGRGWSVRPELWCAHLRELYPTCTVDAVDFSALSWTEQLQLVHDATLIIGTSGAAFTHILWMCPGRSAVLDVYPANYVTVLVNVYVYLSDAAGVEMYRVFDQISDDAKVITLNPEHLEPVVEAALIQLGVVNGNENVKGNSSCIGANQHWKGGVDVCA